MSVHDTHVRVNRHRHVTSVHISRLSLAAVAVLDQIWCIAADEGEATWVEGRPMDVLVPADKLDPSAILLELGRHPGTTVEAVTSALTEIERAELLDRAREDEGLLRLPKLAMYEARRFLERRRKREHRAARAGQSVSKPAAGPHGSGGRRRAGGGGARPGRADGTKTSRSLESIGQVAREMTRDRSGGAMAARALEEDAREQP